LGSLITSTRSPLPSVEKAYVRSSDREMRMPDDTLIADSHALVDAIATAGEANEARVAQKIGALKLRRAARAKISPVYKEHAATRGRRCKRHCAAMVRTEMVV
jgi:hypothetical protein